MPQALVPIIVKLGVSKLVATIAANVIVAAATTFVTSLLFKPSSPKPDSSISELRNPTPPRVYVLGKRRIFGASMLYVNTTDSETVDVWAFCEGPVNAVTQAYLNDDPITISSGIVQALSDGSYKNDRVLAGYNLGALTETAHAPVVSRVTDWTSNHRGDGIVSGYLVKQSATAENYLDIYPQGDSVAMALVVEGRFCYDPREAGHDPYDATTWAYTENSALLLLWYFMVYREYDYATKIEPLEQMWIDAADDCDVAYSLDAGGTEPKYRGSVTFSADTEPKDVEAAIRQTFDGWTGRDENGCVIVYSGAVYTPTVSIGPDDIVDYEVQTYVENENTLNEVIVRYISELHDFNTVECTPWRDDDDINERGILVSSTIDYQVPSHTQARRLAKRELARNNARYRGSVSLVFSARAAITQRYINLTIEEAGSVFFDGVAEITGGERDYETGGVKLDWVSVDGNIDAWNPATEDGDPAPVTTKVYVTPLATPEIDTATALLSSDGSYAQIQITADSDGASYTWNSRWKLSSGSVWSEATHSDVTPGSSITLITNLVPVDAEVDVAIKYSTSDWSDPVTVDTSTAGLAPSPNTAFTATGGTGDVSGSWSNSTSSNFGHSELWSASTDDFGSASQLGSDFSGAAGTTETFTESLAAGTYYLWSVAYNATDSAYSTVGPIEVTVS